MALIRWKPFGTQLDPFRELERMQREMDQLFTTFFGPTRERMAGVFPPVNISEDRDNFYIRAEMPGVDPKDVDLEVEAEQVTIKGERKAEVDEKASYHRKERESGKFARVISLPTKVNADKAEAVFKSGILTITIPKAEEVKPRQIKIKAA